MLHDVLMYEIFGIGVTENEQRQSQRQWSEGNTQPRTVVALEMYRRNISVDSTKHLKNFRSRTNQHSYIKRIHEHLCSKLKKLLYETKELLSPTCLF